jgi:hypothetical protein
MSHLANNLALINGETFVTNISNIHTILTSTLTVPFDSLSGKGHFHLYQMAYSTDSMFKKYLILPLAILVATPILAVADICICISPVVQRFFCVVVAPDLLHRISPFYFLDLVSHIVSVVALPFRLISYYCASNLGIFFSVRHPRYDKQHMLISIIMLSSNPKFVREVLQKRALTEEQIKTTLSLQERIIYRAGYTHDQVSKVKQPWNLTGPTFIGGGLELAFCTAVEKDDQALLNDVYDQTLLNDSPHYIYKLLQYCVEQGVNQAIAEIVKQKYCKQALVICEKAFSSPADSHEITIDSMQWLNIAVSFDQTTLIQKVLGGALSHKKTIACKALAANLEKIVEKAIDGSKAYEQILQAVLNSSNYSCDDQAVLNSSDSNFFSTQRCDAFFAKWIDKPECLFFLHSLEQLLDISYGRFAKKIPGRYLHQAMKHRNLPLMNIFRGHLTDFSELDANQFSLLEKAFSSSQNRTELVGFLCEKRANLNSLFIVDPTLKGHTPLTYAVAIGDHKLVELLCKFESNPNAVNKDQLSPLEIVFLNQKYSIELVDILCKNGADLNTRFKGNSPLKGHTALTYAVATGNRDLVNVLKKYIRNIYPETSSAHPDYFGKTPYQIGFDKGYFDLLALLGLLSFEQAFAWNMSQNRGQPLYNEAAPSSKNTRPPPTSFNGKLTNAETRVLELFELTPIWPKRKELLETYNKLKAVYKDKNLWLAFTEEAVISEKTLQTAFRKLARHIHPDKNLDEKVISEKIYATISAIKDELIKHF